MYGDPWELLHKCERNVLFWKVIGFVALGAAVVLSVVLVFVNSARTPSEAVRKVAVVGDSIVAHGGMVRELNLLLTNRYEFHNHGVPGDSTGDVRDRLEEITSQGYDAYIVLAGVNGISEIKSTLNNLIQCYRLIDSRDGDASIIACTLLPWKGYPTWNETNQSKTDFLNEWIKLYPQHVDRVVDFSWMGGEDSESMQERYRGDELHPNEFGQKEMAKFIFRTIFENKKGVGKLK